MLQHAELPIDERSAVRVSLEAVSELSNFYTEGYDPGFSPPWCLAWDLKRTLGDEGFEIFRELCWTFEPPLFAHELLPGDRRSAITSEQFERGLAQAWAKYTYLNPRCGDVLLVDAMSEARAAGWQIPDTVLLTDAVGDPLPGPITARAATESILDDLARRSGAKRADVQAQIERTTALEIEEDKKDLLQMFYAAQRLARANPRWLKDTNDEHPETAPHVESAISSDEMPTPGVAFALVQWVDAYLDRDDWEHEMNQFKADVSLRALEFEARVRRKMFPFTNFVLTKAGLPDPTNPDNVRVFFRMHQIRLRFNAWHRRQEIQEGGEDQPWQPLTDTILNRLLTIAGDTACQFRPSDMLFRRTAATIAHEAKYDPLLEMLATLESEWDGTPRLDKWLSCATGVTDDAYHSAVGRNVIGGMVKRAREPGCKHDEVMVLSSMAQGKGKSQMCRILALRDEYFTDGFDFGGSPQNTIPQLAGKWCVELSELGGMSKRDADHVKRFISTQSDNYTAKYQAIAEDHPRRLIFIATTNSTKPLSDDTGGRRWLPVHVPGHVDEIDLAWLRSNIGQIVGEAAALHSRGDRFSIPRELWAVAAQHQEAAREVSGLEELLCKWFERPIVTGTGIWVTSADIRHALKLSGHSTNAKYGGILERLGYRNISVVVPEIGKQTRLWVKSSGAPIVDGPALTNCTQLVPVQRDLNRPVEMQSKPSHAPQPPHVVAPAFNTPNTPN